VGARGGVPAYSGTTAMVRSWKLHDPISAAYFAVNVVTPGRSPVTSTVRDPS